MAVPAYLRDEPRTPPSALSRALYEQHTDVDGILFNSRLTSGDSLAIFDRAIGRLAVKNIGELEHHSELPRVLRDHGISIQL